MNTKWGIVIFLTFFSFKQPPLKGVNAILICLGFEWDCYSCCDIYIFHVLIPFCIRMYIVCCEEQTLTLASVRKVFLYFRLQSTNLYENHGSSRNPPLIYTLMCQIRPQFVTIFKEVINSKQMFESLVKQRMSMSSRWHSLFCRIQKYFCKVGI